jgi:hypothetical protein
VCLCLKFSVSQIYVWEPFSCLRFSSSFHSSMLSQGLRKFYNEISK